MRPLRFLTIVAAIAPWLAAMAFVGYIAKPVDRPADYWECQKVFPQRYCKLQHLQATVAQEDNGRR